MGFGQSDAKAELIIFPFLLIKCHIDSEKYCLSIRQSSVDFNTLGITFLLKRVVRVNNSEGTISVSVNAEQNVVLNTRISRAEVGQTIFLEG